MGIAAVLKAFVMSKLVIWYSWKIKIYSYIHKLILWMSFKETSTWHPPTYTCRLSRLAGMYVCDNVTEFKSRV